VTPARSRDPHAAAGEDRLRTIERLIADAAHDIRTPLQALLMHIEVARRAGPKPAVAAGMAGPLDVLQEETHRISALIDALTAVLDARDAPLETFEIDDALGRIAPLLRAGTRSRWVVHGPGRAGNGVFAHTRSDILCYAVVRAALAVRDALPRGGELRVDARPVAPHIEIRITGRPAVAAPLRPDQVDVTIAALAELLRDSDGTIALQPGSTPGQDVEIRILVARAGHRLTGDSAPA